MSGIGVIVDASVSVSADVSVSDSLLLLALFMLLMLELGAACLSFTIVNARVWAQSDKPEMRRRKCVPYVRVRT